MKYAFFTLFLLSRIAFAEPPLIFENYRPGFNNRHLFQQVVEDLQSRYGAKAALAYGDRLEANETTIKICESEFDTRMGGTMATETSLAVEGMARFFIAHEYFHVALRHLDTWKGRSMPLGVTVFASDHEERQNLRALMELQAEYMAALYLKEINLPSRGALLAQSFADDSTGIVTGKVPDYDWYIFESGYPHADVRMTAIYLAEQEGFYYELFNSVLMDNAVLFETLNVPREQAARRINAERVPLDPGANPCGNVYRVIPFSYEVSPLTTLHKILGEIPATEKLLRLIFETAL